MYRILTVLISILSCFELYAQSSSVAEELIELNSYDDKIVFYEQSDLSIDEISELVKSSDNDRQRIELLLFYLRRQFLYDVSKGKDQAQEAIKLSRELNLRLHEGMAMDFFATITAVYESREMALQYSDSSLIISKEIGEHVLESSIYYTRYFIDLVNEEHTSSIINLLKCVELAGKYASPTINNNRQIRLMMFAYQWQNYGLVESQLKKMKFDELNDDDDKLTYLIYQGHLMKVKGKDDSATIYYQRAFNYDKNEETYFEIGLWNKSKGRLDSAIYYIEKSIELKDPRESYFDLRHLALAEIYQEVKNNQLAEKFYKKAISESIRLVERNNEAAYNSQLASFLKDTGKLDSALKYAQRSFDIATEGNYGQSIAASSLLLSELEEQIGHSELSNTFLKKHLAQLGINNQQELNNQLKKAEIDLEIVYWEKVSNQKVERALLFRNLIFVIAFLLLLLVIVVFIMFMNKRSALKLQKSLNRRVLDQKEEISAQGEELRAINDDLERRVLKRTEELQKANTRLSDYSHRLEQYAKLTAHNLRSPLAHIMGLVNVHNSQQLNKEEVQVALNHINQSTQEMDDVIQELSALMDIETADSGQIELVNLYQLIDNLEEWLKGKAGGVDFELIKRIEIDEILLIRPYLERSLKELLINCFHYRSRKRSLKIELLIQQMADKVIFKVVDNGIGIDLKKFGEKVFQLHQRFYEGVNGRGVGLYLVKRQIQALQGTVAVESEVEVGTCFTISLLAQSDQRSIQPD